MPLVAASHCKYKVLCLPCLSSASQHLDKVSKLLVELYLNPPKKNVALIWGMVVGQ